jgi:hypothetical protein
LRGSKEKANHLKHRVALSRKDLPQARHNTPLLKVCCQPAHRARRPKINRPEEGAGRNTWSQHAAGFPEFHWLKSIGNRNKKKPLFLWASRTVPDVLGLCVGAENRVRTIFHLQSRFRLKFLVE